MAVDDHRAVAESKEVGDGRILIGGVCLGFGEAGSGVLSHAPAFADGHCGIAAGCVNGRGADDECHALRCFPCERYEMNRNREQLSVVSLFIVYGGYCSSIRIRN
jgi:hypothetical protein